MNNLHKKKANRQFFMLVRFIIIYLIKQLSTTHFGIQIVNIADIYAE